MKTKWRRVLRAAAWLTGKVFLYPILWLVLGIGLFILGIVTLTSGGDPNPITMSSGACFITALGIEVRNYLVRLKGHAV